MQFGQKIIFDCSFDDYMTKREAYSVADQLHYCFAENRKHKHPFDLHFCNVNYDSSTFARLQNRIPIIRNPGFPLHVHESSYLDLFPREQLVYLTPDCNKDLMEFDPDSIYIVGAMVDKALHRPLELVRAKELGIKTARLPLNQYLGLGANSGKNVPIAEIMKIMLELKSSGSWESALKYVPKRKLPIGKPIERSDMSRWKAIGNQCGSNVDHKYRDRLSNRGDRLSTVDRNSRIEKFQTNAEPNYCWNQPDDDTISTADKFKRKIISEPNKFRRTFEPQFYKNRTSE